MILVVGSTGALGGEICRLLAARNPPVRALVRATSNPHKIDHLRQLGAEIAVGDLRDAASLRAVCQGITAVISTVCSVPFSYQPGTNDIQTVDLAGELNLIAAAKASGVGHFVYTSFSRNLDRDFPLRNAKRAIEQRLRACGLTHTILRPSYFMEAWFSPAVGFDVANGTVRIYGTGAQSISWVSLADVAAFAVASLDNPAARNATLELGGPETLSPHQVIEKFQQAAHRQLEVTHVSAETLAAQLKGAADPMQQSFIGLMMCYAQGDPVDMRGMHRSFSVSPTSVDDYIRRTVPHPAGV